MPTPEEASYAPVVSDERNALLERTPTAPASEDAAPVGHAGDVKGEPTQRLLTALGRFQREVAKVREGQPRSGWPDECMNQLVNAVEIAMDHHWADVVEALTETARVLKSFDVAGQPAECLPFLEDSYEILCLMVGDLLVGNVRPGVMQKWRERHEDVLDDLTAAGLSLVRDPDEAQYATAAPAPSPEVHAPQFAADDTPPASPFDFPTETHADTELPDELPALDDLSAFEAAPAEPELADAGAVDTEAAQAAEDAPEAAHPATTESSGPPPEVSRALDGLCDALGHIERDPGGVHEAAYAMIFDAVQFLTQHAAEHGNVSAIPACETLERMCEQAKAHGLEAGDKFFELAFGFCEAYVESHGDSAAQAAMSWIMECEAHLIDMPPAEPDFEAAAQSTESDSVELDSAPSAVLDVLEGISETSEQALDSLDDEPVQEFDAIELLEDAAPSDLAMSPNAAPPDEPPAAATDQERPDWEGEAPAEPVQPAEPEAIDIDALDEDSPLRLLAVAQRLASQGNASDAKLLALRAAARIAADEAAQADARLKDAEERLQQGAAAIETARDKVTDAEQALAATEARVTEGTRTLEAQQAHVASIDARIEEVNAGLEALDAQIAELLARREDEARTLAERQTEVASARERETVLLDGLAELREEENDARRKLEDARQAVKTSQLRRTEIENERERAREAVSRQRSSLSELEQTITHFTGDQLLLETSEEEGFLF